MRPSIYNIAKTIVVWVALAPLLAERPAAVHAADELPVTYGTRTSGNGSVSLNGTSAFAKLVEEGGIDVKTARRLSPRVDRFDCIFWFPDTRRMMSSNERERLEQWLQEGWGRTLVVVGRDYDATLDYLQAVADQTDAEASLNYRRRLARAIAADHLRKLDADAREFDDWVAWEPKGRTKVGQISGPLAEGLGPVRLWQGRHPDLPRPPNESIAPQFHHRVLLSADDEPFIIEVKNDLWEEGRVLVVSNGSFLLNYGLTEPNHRELATRLIAEIDTYGPVLLLESGEGGVPISEREESRQRTMWDWMREWPFSFIIPHFLVVGVLVYFVYFPIFGRPKQIQGPSSTDFGQHVEALGELMEKTRDRDYAVAQLRHYHEQVRRDSSGLGAPAKNPTPVSASPGQQLEKRS